MKLGIIGTGNMAAQMATAAGSIADLEISSVLSRNKERANAFCSSYVKTAQPYEDMETFLAANDAVYIATPPDQHLPAILTSLEAGKAVLCEKPLTLSPEETARAIAKAKETSTLLMEAVWTVTLPSYRALKTLLASTDTSQARMRFDFSYPLVATADAHFFDLDRGGVFLDRAVYGYGAALFLFGAITDQQVQVERDAAKLDRAATLLLRHASGAQSLITLSFDHLGTNTLDVATRQGVAQLGPSSLAAETLSWVPYSAPNMTDAPLEKPGLANLLKSKPALRKLKGRMAAMKGTFHGFGLSPYKSVLEEFAEAAVSGASESTIVPLPLSQQIADLVAEARRST